MIRQPVTYSGHDNLFIKWGKEYKIDPLILKALSYIESDKTYDPEIIGDWVKKDTTKYPQALIDRIQNIILSNKQYKTDWTNKLNNGLLPSAFGLMQINTNTYPAYSENRPLIDLFDPDFNIKVGAHILHDKIKAHGGDVVRGMQGYVGSHDKIGANYTNVIMKYYNTLKTNGRPSAGPGIIDMGLIALVFFFFIR
jgi:hypothetical protein